MSSVMFTARLCMHFFIPPCSEKTCTLHRNKEIATFVHKQELSLFCTSNVCYCAIIHEFVHIPHSLLPDLVWSHTKHAYSQSTCIVEAKENGEPPLALAVCCPPSSLPPLPWTAVSTCLKACGSEDQLLGTRTCPTSPERPAGCLPAPSGHHQQWSL